MGKTVNALTKNDWDAFVLKYGPRSGRFLQSWSWGEFQKTVGEHVDRVVWKSDAGEGYVPPIQAIAQVIRKQIPHFGSYAYIPRGPIEKHPEQDLIADAANVANATDLFVRVEALRFNVTDIETSHRNSVLTHRIKPLQPAHTLITNLSISNDQLLANMHEKTRYNIRLAEKKGVQIEIGTANLDDVWPLFEVTASRDVFRLHEKEYYQKMLEKLGTPSSFEEGAGGGRVFIAVAKHENDILAANIMIDFGDTRTYLHGASSNVKRNFMAPYLLHWELMKDAKSKGIRFYDWWGVAPLDAESNHPWAGISRFKRGFGGEEISYAENSWNPWTYDVVLKPWRYLLYQFARKMNRFIRKKKS